jgi:hypothetical protein
VLNAVSTTQLVNIDAKLGPQISGGLSGALQKTGALVAKTWNFLQLDRVLNVLTWVATLHNAYMLSNALSQTLFSMISNVLDVFGIEDEEGNPLDVGRIVSGWTDSFFKTLLGEETVDGIKTTWKKYSRIYQAAANLVWALQSIGYSVLGALEIVGSYVALIGNALKKFGVVWERAYRWMNPSPDFQNPYFTAIDQATEVVEAIDSVAGEVLNIQEVTRNLGQQRDTLNDALAAVTRDPKPENLPTQSAESSAKAASASPPINPSDLNPSP